MVLLQKSRLKVAKKLALFRSESHLTMRTRACVHFAETSNLQSPVIRHLSLRLSLHFLIPHS